MAPGDRPLTLYDVVAVIATDRTVALEVAGATGVIVGVSESEERGREPAYAVLVDGLDRTVMLGAPEMRPSGDRKAPNQLYDGVSIRVSSRGEVKNPEASE